MKRLFSFLFVSLFAFSGLFAQSVIDDLLAKGGVFTFGSRRGTGYVMAETATHTVKGVTKKAGDTLQQWAVIPSGGGYVVRNVNTGRYIQKVDGTNKTYTTSLIKSVLYIKASPKSTSTKPRIIISTSNGFSDYTCLHDDASHNVVNWNANNSADANPCSDWEVAAVEGVDMDALRQYFDELSGICDPADGIYVRICNTVTGMFISERGDDNSLTLAYDDEEDMAQLWKMTSAGNGKYHLQNMKTLRYAATGGSMGYMNTTSTAQPDIQFGPTATEWETHYNILCNGTYLYNSGGNNIITGNGKDARCQWLFFKSKLTAEEIAEKQGDYPIFTDLRDNQTKYSNAFVKFFTTASCSVLKDEYQQMSDADLTAALVAAGLPEYLQKIALKVKNDAWAPYEKQFRVADYGAYSKFDSWHVCNQPSMTGTGYNYGRLSNPTGITAHAGDILVVFCESAAPSGTTLQLEYVQGTAYSGTTLGLKKGMNVFTFNNDVTFHIFYQVNSTTRDLADFPRLNIHIEGGRLNGYFDLTRGHTNEDWQYMVKNMLGESSVVNLKAPSLVFAFDAAAVKKACPKNMVEVLGIWDDFMKLDRELLGVNNTYIPNVEERFNNVYNCFSGDENYTGYMHATNYGGYFNDTTIPTIMNYEQMQQDGIWGPAHELGHLHQALFNLVGTTEASNNMFANAYVYKQGRTTQRAAAPKTVFDAFAKNTSWYSQDIWTMTKLYYQLYTHYVILGNHPTFFPELFTKLRQSGLDRNGKTPSVVTGLGDCLKFARYCCEVAQEDLSELFEVYGFFHPCTDLAIYDYGNFTVNTTQADIDETIAYMHTFPRKMGNILFQDDRIKPVPATYEGHKEGETKKRRSDDQIGSGVSAGNYGQYTDYISADTRDTYECHVNGYYYNSTSGGKITVRGTGAQGLVGIKVYDEQHKLIYVANTSTFTLPTNLRKLNYTVYAAMGDGTDRLLGWNEPLPDGITTPNPLKGGFQNGTAYDLQGRILGTSPFKGERGGLHGLYIVGGRKVIR